MEGSHDRIFHYVMVRLTPASLLALLLAQTLSQTKKSGVATDDALIFLKAIDKWDQPPSFDAVASTGNQATCHLEQQPGCGMFHFPVGVSSGFNAIIRGCLETNSHLRRSLAAMVRLTTIRVQPSQTGDTGVAAPFVVSAT